MSRLRVGLLTAAKSALNRHTSRPNTPRGDLGDLPHPDCAALAYMDQAQQLAPDTWNGMRKMDSQAYLDIHQLRASSGTTVRSARATAIMAAPTSRPTILRAELAA